MKKKSAFFACIFCGLSLLFGSSFPLNAESLKSETGTKNEPVRISQKTADGSPISVEFSSQDGSVQSIQFRGETLTLPDDSYMIFDLNQGEKETRNEKWVAWRNTEFQGLEQPDPQTVVTRHRVGGWSVTLTYFWDAKREMLGRKMKLRWDGSEEVKIRAFWWRFPTLKADASAFVLSPGQFPPQKTKVSEMTGKCGVWERPGILQLSEKASALFFVDFRDPMMDSCSTEFERKGESGVQVTQVFQMMGRMKPGSEQELGATWLWFLPTDGESALLRAHDGMARLGQVVPKDRPEEFRNLLLYSFHPGGWIGSNLQDLGGFAASIPYVDRIAETGANAVWMLPIEDRGIYWPRDYYQFQAGLGTGEEYRALVQRLHDCGFYVMQDCVPHGGSNSFERAKQHPEWLVHDEDGATFDYWCFDFNWPTWRAYMKDVAKHYMKNYGVDGYRIDAVGGSKVPNWNPDIPYARASLSKLQAGFNMQSSIREGVKEENPQHGGTLAEVGSDFFGMVSDAIYDFSGCYHVFQRARQMPAAEYASSLRRWLYECQYGSLKGLLRLRHSESHDSLRSQLWYGTEPARAIVALTTFIDGIPLLFQGQEVGNVETYAKLFAVRKALPEMQNANYDYLGVTVPDGVFAVGYEKDGLRSIGLINFNETPIQFDLSLPNGFELDPKAQNSVTAMLANASVPVRERTFPVSLKPFGFEVFALRAPVSASFQELKSQIPAEKPIAAPENALELSGSHWKAFINRTTGLLTSMTQDGVEVLGPMSFSLETDAPAFPVPTDAPQTVIFVKKYGSASLQLTYAVKDDQLSVTAEWLGGGAPQNSALNFICPRAQTWSAATAEGLLRDHLIFRNEKHVDVNARHGIYWRPLELDVLYDSLYQPLWQNAFLTAEWANAGLKFAFDPQNLPARVRWLNQFKGQKVLTASFSLNGPLDAGIPGRWTVALSPMTASADEMAASAKPAPQTQTGAYSLRPTIGGWLFENEFYALRLTRFGSIQSFVSKKVGGKPLFRSGTLYSDYGFGPQGERFSNEFEVEAWSRIETQADGALRLHFEGRLRKMDRFGRIPNPVTFMTEFTLNGSETLTMRSKISAPTAPQTDAAFLAWMLSSERIDGFDFRKDGKSVAAGNPPEAKGRSWESKAAGSMPDELLLLAQGQPVLSVHDFRRDPIGNVFLDHTNFFFCFFDGKMPSPAPAVRDCEWQMTVR